MLKKVLDMSFLKCMGEDNNVVMIVTHNIVDIVSINNEMNTII